VGKLFILLHAWMAFFIVTARQTGFVRVGIGMPSVSNSQPGLCAVVGV
jgi:hypothetical protein